MIQLIDRLIRKDEGQDLIEYALLAGFISLASVLAITNVGTGVNTVYGAQAQVTPIPGGGSQTFDEHGPSTSHVDDGRVRSHARGSQ